MNRNTNRRYSENRQQPPMYHRELAHYPVANPILITREYLCVKYIRQCHGFCLWCSQSLANTDLSGCFQRETWVLYSHPRYFSTATQLANALQHSGAAEITLICLGYAEKPERQI